MYSNKKWSDHFEAERYVYDSLSQFMDALIYARVVKIVIYVCLLCDFKSAEDYAVSS